MNFSIHAMSASIRTALTRELKPFEAPLLSTNDPQFLWPKYHILKYFEDWLKTKVWNGKSEKQKNVYIITNLWRAYKNHCTYSGIQLAHKVFNYAQSFICVDWKI